MRTSAIVTCLIALSVGLLVACDKAPTSPTPPARPTSPSQPSPNPTGYRVSGHVSSDSGLAVPGARVEVMEGRATGLVQETNSSGWYEFSGLSGYTQFRVTKEAYQPQSADAWVYGDSVLDFKLTRGDDFSGTYTLTITAADECRVGLGEGRLPEEARVRRYTATVTQRGPELDVLLTGAKFGTRFDQGDRFRGRVEPGRVVFDLIWADEDAPWLIEQLPDSTSLVVHGTVVATDTRGRLAGVLEGYLQVFDIDFRFGTTIAWCHSRSHQFVFSR